MMKLAALFPDHSIDPRFAGRDVSGVTADSRAVKPGYVFVAIPGEKADGLRYVTQALAAGAVAIVAERAPDTIPQDAAVILVKDARRVLALSAAKIFSRQPQVIAAVTGTSGKTSVAAFTRQIWAALGFPAASIGTIGVVSPQGEIYGSLTTPDPVALHQKLDQLAGEGVTHLVLEASSHGLEQHRLDGVRIQAGAFTNLSRDHLDYHLSLEAYLKAKLRLFDDLIADGGHAVICADHEQASSVIEAAARRPLHVLTVGRSGEGIRLRDVTVDGHAQRLVLDYNGVPFNVRLPLVGEFQIENALVAAGLVLATGGDPKAVFTALEALQGAKGRLELVGEKNGAPIFVDYAHKPDALAKALEALRPYATRRLIVLFGAGGDRDTGKRPIMGAIAHEKADQVIITDDNPRSEDAASIRAAIVAAAPDATEIAGRGEAIGMAVAGLQAGDVLLIAGKGHESGQIVGERVLPFSDHDAVAAAMAGKDYQ